MQNRQGISRDLSVCSSCGKKLSPDEIAATRKLINRGAKEFLCVSCLAAYFDVMPEHILERISYFRSAGCTLFDPDQ